MGATVEQAAPSPTIDPSRIDQPRDGASVNGAHAHAYTDGDGIAPTTWLREMREMRREAATERQEQTKAFVAALDGLGAKMDTNFDAIRADLRRHLTGLIFTFVLALSVLAGLAGVGVWVRGMGISVTATPATSAAPTTGTAPTHDPDPSGYP